jgi:hypothetical protein
MRGNTWRLVWSVVAALCLAGAGTLAWLALRPAPGTTFVDMDGRPVVLDDPPDVAASDPVATGGRFVAPRQHLDVPLFEMNVVNNVINPPTLTDAFVVRGFGSPQVPGSGLVVVTMHAVRGGNAPGNAFFDMGPTASPVTIAVGDPLQVDGVTYTVTRTQVLDKTAASTSADIWARPAQRDGELVVLTCLQRATEQGPARDNLVLFATRSS